MFRMVYAYRRAHSASAICTTGSQPAHVSGAINVVLVTCMRFHSLKMMQAAYSGELGVLGWITDTSGCVATEQSLRQNSHQSHNPTRANSYRPQHV